MTSFVTKDEAEIASNSSSVEKSVTAVTLPVTRRHSITSCPHCGHPMVADEIARNLPKVSRRIYEVVRDAGTAGIASRDIAGIVYAEDSEGGPVTNSVSVLISQRINPVLKRYGLQCVSSRGPGSLYRLMIVEP